MCSCCCRRINGFLCDHARQVTAFSGKAHSDHSLLAGCRALVPLHGVNGRALARVRLGRDRNRRERRTSRTGTPRPLMSWPYRCVCRGPIGARRVVGRDAGDADDWITVAHGQSAMACRFRRCRKLHQLPWGRAFRGPPHRRTKRRPPISTLSITSCAALWNP